MEALHVQVTHCRCVHYIVKVVKITRKHSWLLRRTQLLGRRRRRQQRRRWCTLCSCSCRYWLGIITALLLRMIAALFL